MPRTNKPQDHLSLVPKHKSSMGAHSPAKTATQYRRSRAGCFTCRLRRKKCDEIRPTCKACKNLGLRCDYKRPHWWGSADARRRQKEYIKGVIKETQSAKKTSRIDIASLGSITPDLCHTASTPPESRCDSVHSTPRFSEPAFSSPIYHPIHLSARASNEVDIKTERRVFVDDTHTRRESTLSSSLALLPTLAPEPQTWYVDDPSIVDFGHFDVLGLPRDHNIEVDACDQALLDHFLHNIVPLLFPVLDIIQDNSVKYDLLYPALESNKSFRHCCLKTAALDLSIGFQDDVLRHRYAVINELCKAFEHGSDHDHILETTLALIFFPCVIGRPDDDLSDISWHQHLKAAQSLAEKMELTTQLTHGYHPPFNMSLMVWIDILGATMTGTSPLFADIHRHLNIHKRPAGLPEMMGCDDSIMYIISEIACLEERRRNGMDEFVMCRYVEMLGHELTHTELHEPQDPLVARLSHLFRIAARVYLCSLIPGARATDANMVDLVERFALALTDMEPGPRGFDRSLVWPLLMVGANSTALSTFRSVFAERMILLGELGETGAVVRLKEVLTSFWDTTDGVELEDGIIGLHWRDVMARKGWDCLLI